jgi:hypothetical protein
MADGVFFSNDAFESASKIVTKVYSKTGVRVKPQYPVVFNDFSGDADPKRSFMTFLAVRGMTLASLFSEDGVPTLTSMSEGESQTVNFAQYGIGYSVTRKAMQYDPKAILSRAPSFLNYSMQLSEELLIWQPLNLGTSVNGFDGVPLFSTAHPLQNMPSITVSNYAGNTALSVEALNVGITQMNLTVDDNNLPTYRTPRQLVIGTGINQQAREIIGAKGYPYTNDNRPNIVNDAVELTISRYITGPTAWYILAGKGGLDEADSHSLYFAFQEKDRQRTYIDPATEKMFHYVDATFLFGFLDWRGTYGSLGS